MGDVGGVLNIHMDMMMTSTNSKESQHRREIEGSGYHDEGQSRRQYASPTCERLDWLQTEHKSRISAKEYDFYTIHAAPS